MSPVRYLFWTRDAKRDSRATRKFSFESGLPFVNVFDGPIFNSSRKKSVFILGSGSSINEMTGGQFDHIKDQESVGINFWFFHDFVPNVFSFDSGKVEELDRDDSERSQIKLAQVFHRPEILARLPNILYLRPHAGDESYLFPVAEELRETAWVSGRANLLSTNSLGLRADLKVLLKKLSNRSVPPGVLPDNGSSVVRLIFLALAQGYRRIVLCGVDLDSRPHFWMNDDYAERYPEHVRLFPAPDDKLHGTAEARGRPLGNLEFLVLLDRVLREEKAGQLFVGSTSSRLSGLLSPYSWPESAD